MPKFSSKLLICLSAFPVTVLATRFLQDNGYCCRRTQSSLNSIFLSVLAACSVVNGVASSINAITYAHLLLVVKRQTDTSPILDLPSRWSGPPLRVS
jgi:hypothetical protein